MEISDSDSINSGSSWRSTPRQKKKPSNTWTAHENENESSEDSDFKTNQALPRIQLADQQKREMDTLRKENTTLKKEIAEMRMQMEELIKQLRPTDKKRKKEKASPSSEDEENHPDKIHCAKMDISMENTSEDSDANETKKQKKKTTHKEIPAPPNTQKVPPIVLRGKDRWTEISKTLKNEKINYTKARLTTDGITVTPATDNDYKKMMTTLKQRKEEYHTFTLPEDRLLRVVIRGIPSGITETDVHEDLKEQGFAPAAVHRIKSRRTKQELPLVLVQVPPNQTNILEINRCCSLVVRVERQKQKNQATQCHRCQRFGHGQSRCTAQPKCVKCGEDHRTNDCKKKREEPAKCANCQGEHPASYMGCPSFPKTKKHNWTEKPQSTRTRSYAQAAGGSQTSGQQENNAIRRNADLEKAKSMLAQFQQMLTAMTTFIDNIQPTP